MTYKKGPRPAPAPFELLIASRPSHESRSSAIAASAAVAVHAVALAAVTLVAGPPAQPAPRDGVDTIMLELPTVSLPGLRERPAGGIARTAGDPGTSWVVRSATRDALDLPPLEWAPPAPETPAPGSDAIFASYNVEQTGEAGFADEAGPHEASLEELAAAPTYTPFTRGTELENREEIRRYLLERYPADLRDMRIGGRTVLWILVDESGHARKAILLTSSGYETLDNAALASTHLMQFAPAWNSGHIVPVWVQLPVNFRVDP